MTSANRRDILLSAAAATAAAATPATVLAQGAAPAPAAGRQAPGFFRFKVGEAEITVLHDGFSTRRSEGLVRNVPIAQVDEALRAAFIDPNDMTNVFNITVVRIGGATTVIDAGFADNGLPTTGQVAANMAAAGIDPASVTNVLVSHFHPDHINGLRRRDGSLVYPNAQIHIPQGDWDHYMDEARMNAAPEAARGAFLVSRRVFAPLAGSVARYDGERDLVPGIRAIPTKGHTPGHHSFLVTSGSGRVIVQGDVTGIPALFVRHPGWHSSFDMDATLAETSRRRLYDMAAADRIPIVGYHYPFPAVGHVAKDGNGYRLEMMHWRSVV